jgi:cytosine permease
MTHSPATHKQSWLQLLSIQAGGALCLPVIMIGQIVCQNYGWLAATLIVGVGNLLLLVLALAFAAMSTHRPQSTAQHAVYYFGQQGRLGFASLMTVTMLAWFAVQLNVMSLSLKQLFDGIGLTIALPFFNVGLGLLLSGVMCFGMKAVEKLSNISAPLLVLTLLYALVFTSGTLPEAVPLTLSWIGGLSLIIGGGIGSVIDLPTFFQHARSRKDALIAVVLIYGLAVPFIEGVGLYLTAITGGTSILEVLQMGHGVFWILWISFFILLCGWTTNNANLYSATTSSYSLTSRFGFKGRTLALGIIASFIACFDPLGNLEIVLDLFGITIGSMGAVILTGYLLEITKQKSSGKHSFASLFIGVGSGLISLIFHISATGVVAFDGFLIAGISEVGLSILNKRKGIHEATH